jgi:hypothetical protein
MIPSFNTAGPCIPGEHYMLSPEPRVRHVMRLIDERKYFTLHAGRQTGKSTCARWLASKYNAEDRYRALWVDIQTARDQPELEPGMREILARLTDAARRVPGLTNVPTEQETEALLRTPTSAMLLFLRRLCEASPRPVVLFFDEADGLVGPTMVSFLTQLRSGYIDRSATPFPHSVVLVGMRQVRDYVVTAEDRRAVAWLGSSSPFNITAEAATLEMFTRKDVAELLQQHTDHTGQRWDPDAVDLIYELSQGHPWLVNALADQIVNRDVEDRTVTVTPEHVQAAKETIIQQRRTHIDSLLARLREDRVRRVIEPMLVGGQVVGDTMDDDFAYVMGLGLVTKRQGQLQVANPIYREVIVRALTWAHQVQLHQPTSWYVRGDGTLDMPKLMAAWQEFWREDGHLAAEGFHYREAGPHLMLMAFLQRILNGGGSIEREYGLGRGAVDLVITWKGQRHLIEIKLRRDTRTEDKALDQAARYLDGLGMQEGWLVLFDLRKDVPWEDKLFVREVQHAGKLIHVVGC